MNDINNLLGYERFKETADNFARFACVSYGLYGRSGVSLISGADGTAYEELSPLFPALAEGETLVHRTKNKPAAALCRVSLNNIDGLFLTLTPTAEISEAKLKEALSFLASLLKDSFTPRQSECSNSLMLSNLFTAVEQSPVSIVITDKNGIVEYVNPFFKELTGFTIDEMRGSSMSILKSGEHDEEFYKNLWDTILSGRAWTGKLINRKKDGSKYIESARIAPVIENGEIIRFIGIKTDITEIEQFMLLQESSNQLLDATVKKRTEKLRNAYMLLKSNRDLLKKAQKVARMGGWTRDLITRKGYWTDEAFEIFGLEKRPSSAPSMEEIVNAAHPDDKAEVSDWLESFFKFAEPKEFNFRIIRPDGEERIISSIYSYELGEDGCPVRVNGIHHDRTESIRRAQELEKHEKMLNSILLAAGVGICVINSEGLTELVNPEFQSIFSLKASEAYKMRMPILRLKKQFQSIFAVKASETLGLPIDEAFPSLFNSADAHKLKEALGSESEFVRFNYRLKLDEASEKKLIISVARQQTDHDDITIITASDVTELTELHERQKAQEAMLIQQSKMAAMGEMIGVITHQWKQPLNAVSLLSQLIESEFVKKELTEEDLHEYISNIYEQIDFMSQTVRDFTDFFKPGSHKGRFEAVSALREIIELVSLHFANSSIRVEFTASVEEVYAHGSKSELKQIILNLLSNAKDAILARNGENGEIKVSCAADNDEIIISVADNGGGIPEAAMENLFRSYFTTKGDNGTGIGLYISKLIAETKLKGTISAANSGTGAVFTLKIKRNR